MPRDLFGNVTRPSISIGNRKWYTVPLSLLSHSIVVAMVIVVPLMATDVLPPPWQPMKVEFVSIKPPSPPPLPKIRPEPRVVRVENAIPTEAPDGFTPERPVPDSVEDTMSPGGCVIEGNFDKDVMFAAPPEPPKRLDPVRPGGQIRQPQRIRDTRPVYPQMALAARVEGIVIIEATVGIDGRITNARVLRSVPLLDQAALEAVRQWEYLPTTLNGVPVPVIMSVTVTFKLSDR